MQRHTINPALGHFDHRPDSTPNTPQTTINSSLANFDQLPDSALIRPQIVKQILGVSIATVWRLISAKKLKSVKLTQRTRAIRAGDLRVFMNGGSHE